MSNLFQYNGKEWVELAKDGVDGVSPDPQKVALEASKLTVERLSPLIPSKEALKKEVLVPQDVRDSLETLRDEERLDKEYIKGLDDYDEVSKLARKPKVTREIIRSGGSVGIGSSIASGTPGSVLFVGGTVAAPTFAQDNANFYFDDTNNILNVSSSLGSEIAINGSFTSNPSGSWSSASVNPPWSWTAGQNRLNKTADGTTAITQSGFAGLYVGLWVYWSFTISNWTVGTITFSVNGTAQTPYEGAASADGTYTGRFLCTSTSTVLTVSGTNTSRFSITGITVKPITGGQLRVGGATYQGGQSQISMLNNSAPTAVGNLHQVFDNSGVITGQGWSFSGTLKGAMSVNNSGNTNYYGTASSQTFLWRQASTVSAGSVFMTTEPSSLQHSGYGGFVSGVNAGASSAPTSTMQSQGSFSVLARRLTTDTTLTASSTGTNFILDGTSNSSCSGTPSTACSSWANQTDCEKWDAHGGCVWSAGSDCSAFDNEVGMGTCTGTSGCSASTTSCGDANNTDQSTCETRTYGGSCSWDTSTCPAIGDEPTCSGTTGCTWNGSSCEGNLCNGTYYTGSCTGTYGAACSGTSTCAGINDSTNCGLETGCSWISQIKVYLPAVATVPGREYTFVNGSSTGADAIIYPYQSGTPTQEVNQAASYTIGNYKQAATMFPYQLDAECSALGSEGACTAQTGCTANYTPCTWSDPDCTGNAACAAGTGTDQATCEAITYYSSCSGTYVSEYNWWIK